MRPRYFLLIKLLDGYLEGTEQFTLHTFSEFYSDTSCLEK